MRKFLRTLLGILGWYLSATTWSSELPTAFSHPWYIGALAGYGSTTWGGLVPSPENTNIAIKMSAPLEVAEGGSVWGGIFGYELSPFFALEATYMHYPDAHVKFDKFSIFSFKHHGETRFQTSTELFGVLAKLMVAVPNTQLRIYSSVGGADVHREDMLVSRWRLSPIFGLGVNYHFNDRFMGEIGGNYIAGYGEALLSPVDTYWPFLYSASLKLIYCFG